MENIINLQLFAAPNTNVTTDAALSAENKTFYDMALIQEAGPELIHDQFGQKRPIPKNGGKKIEFRKYAALPKALAPLTEGVTPDGKKLSVSTVLSPRKTTKKLRLSKVNWPDFPFSSSARKRLPKIKSPFSDRNVRIAKISLRTRSVS